MRWQCLGFILLVLMLHSTPQSKAQENLEPVLREKISETLYFSKQHTPEEDRAFERLIQAWLRSIPALTSAHSKFIALHWHSFGFRTQLALLTDINHRSDLSAEIMTPILESISIHPVGSNFDSILSLMRRFPTNLTARAYLKLYAFESQAHEHFVKDMLFFRQIQNYADERDQDYLRSLKGSDYLSYDEFSRTFQFELSKFDADELKWAYKITNAQTLLSLSPVLNDLEILGLSLVLFKNSNSDSAVLKDFFATKTLEMNEFVDHRFFTLSESDQKLAFNALVSSDQIWGTHYFSEERIKYLIQDSNTRSKLFKLAIEQAIVFNRSEFLEKIEIEVKTQTPQINAEYAIQLASCYHPERILSPKLHRFFTQAWIYPLIIEELEKTYADPNAIFTYLMSEQDGEAKSSHVLTLLKRILENPDQPPLHLTSDAIEHLNHFAYQNPAFITGLGKILTHENAGTRPGIWLSFYNLFQLFSKDLRPTDAQAFQDYARIFEYLRKTSFFFSNAWLKSIDEAKTQSEVDTYRSLALGFFKAITRTASDFELKEFQERGINPYFARKTAEYPKSELKIIALKSEVITLFSQAQKSCETAMSGLNSPIFAPSKQ